MEISNSSVDLKFDEKQLASIEAAKNIVTNLQAESVRLAKLVQVHEADVKEAVAAKNALDAEFEATGASLESVKSQLAERRTELAQVEINLESAQDAHRALLAEDEKTKTHLAERESTLSAREDENKRITTHLSEREAAIVAHEYDIKRKQDILTNALASL